MIYHSKTDPARKKILIAFIFVVLIVGASRFLFPRTWSSIVIESSPFFLRIGSGLSSLTARAGDAVTFGHNERENAALKSQVATLSLELNDRNALANENASLRQMIGRNDERSETIAVVLSKPTLTPYDTFIIDQGTDDGIKLNDQVLAGSSTAIGTVTEVYPKISKVTAYSSPDTRHPVFIGDDHIQAEAVGLGNGNFKIVLPQGSEVKEGDAIIVPDIIPTVFGTVEKIVPSDQPSFINILFKEPVNLSELYYVEVIK